MNIETCATELQEKLNTGFKPGTFSVGHNQVDTIVIYEHVRGFAKRRVRPSWIPDCYKVEFKYVGRIKLA